MSTLQMGGSTEQMPVSHRYYNVLCHQSSAYAWNQNDSIILCARVKVAMRIMFHYL